MRTVTLAQLRQDVQNQADIAGLTQRHGATLLTRFINQGIQRFREDLSNEGARHFLAVATGTMHSGATDGFPFHQLDAGRVASGIVRVYGLDVKTPGGGWRRLEHTTFEDRTSHGGGTSLGEPSVWAEYQTTKLAVMPPPIRQCEYILWYLPVQPDLAADGDMFDGVAGWEDYVVWDVVARMMIRDQNPSYELIVRFRAETMAKILRAATRVTTAGGATIGRDSMGARLRGRSGIGARYGGGRIFDDTFDGSFE